MDRSLYIAMNAAQHTMLAQAKNANNLANINTTGFRADYDQFKALPVIGEGLPSRAYNKVETAYTDFTTSTIQSTGRDLDISIQGEGFISVQGRDGREGYTRAGDLQILASGQLVTGTGLPVLGEGGEIFIPPSEKLEIGTDGTISFQPLGESENALAVVDRLKLVRPDIRDIFKDKDGLIRLKNGQNAEPDALVQIATGTLEQSNVNGVASLVKMIELQRQYEMQIKMMKTTQENSASSARLMQLQG